jgi:RNA polymerase sigma factor (TIGR02999 family)
MARRQLRHERANHTLQPTALVHEVFIRLVDVRQVRWQDRSHFLAMSARLMRRVLVDAARSRGYQKRGAGDSPVQADLDRFMASQKAPDIIALDSALEALETEDPRKAQVVQLRFFGGLSIEETAEALSTSVATVVRDWKLARTWLLRELRREKGAA